jgi:hypothetical protein
VVNQWAGWDKPLSAAWAALGFLGLTLQVFDFARYTVPFFGIFWGFFFLGDIGPNLCEFGVEFQEGFLVFGQLVFRVNGVHRAFGFAQGAVDTLVWVDHQEVGAFVEAVNRAYFYAVGMFAFNAVFTHNKCHFCKPRKLGAQGAVFSEKLMVKNLKAGIVSKQALA